MKRTSDTVQVETHRSYTIMLDKVSGKFSVQEAMEIEPADTIGAARNAIDRHIADLNKGVRRKILTFEERSYYDDDKPSTISVGELTSWTMPRGYRSSFEGVCMFGKDRRNLAPGHIYEDTPENRALMQEVIELEKKSIAARREIKQIKEKKLTRAALPTHLKAKAE